MFKVETKKSFNLIEAFFFKVYNINLLDQEYYLHAL